MKLEANEVSLRGGNAGLKRGRLLVEVELREEKFGNSYSRIPAIVELSKVPVVSQILRVFGSSGHESDNKILQNKQGTDGGVPTSSPMLKLEREMESRKMSVLHAYIFTYLSLSIAFLFMKKDDDPLFFGKWVIGFRNGREACALLMCQPFFLSDN